jgi:hypothetical protein
MRVFLLISTFLLSSFLLAAGKTAWHPLSNASTQQQSPMLATESHPDGVTLDISIPGYFTHSLRSGGNDYQSINLPGMADQPPLIPQLVQCIAIPNNCRLEDISINILTSDTLSYTLPLPPVSKTVDGKMSFVPDPSIYTQDDFYPQNPVTIEKTGFIRDQKAAWIRINPVSTIPSPGKSSSIITLN